MLIRSYRTIDTISRIERGMRGEREIVEPV
jgi:hypothetical protein